LSRHLPLHRYPTTPISCSLICTARQVLQAFSSTLYYANQFFLYCNSPFTANSTCRSVANILSWLIAVIFQSTATFLVAVHLEPPDPRHFDCRTPTAARNIAACLRCIPPDGVVHSVVLPPLTTQRPHLLSTPLHLCPPPLPPTSCRDVSAHFVHALRGSRVTFIAPPGVQPFLR
jgi:hypothetical protein